MASFIKDGQVNGNITINIPARSNQDRGKYWNVNDSQIFVVADGHGLNGEKFADLVISYLDSVVSERKINFIEDDLTETINQLFNQINENAKLTYGSLYGGSTVSLLIIRNKRDFWVANAGDSSIALVDKQKSTLEIITEDHGPNNIKEAERIYADFPDTIFEYDRIRKYEPVIPLYRKTDDGLIKIHPPSEGYPNYYLKNRQGEHATYVGFDKTHKLALTRGIGDFLFQERMGLTSNPFIQKHSPLSPDQILICASDGFWDCWTHDEIVEFVMTKELSSLEGEHINKSNQCFGSNKDDTLIHLITG